MGRPRIIRRVFSRRAGSRSAGDPAAIARDLLQRACGGRHAPAGVDSWVEEARFEGRSGLYMRLAPRISRRPVLGVGLVLACLPRGSRGVVSLLPWPCSARMLHRTPAHSVGDVRLIVGKRLVRKRGLRRKPHIRAVFVAYERGVVPAYEARIPFRDPPSDKIAIIDARSGKILEVFENLRPLRSSVRPAGRVYRSSPSDSKTALQPLHRLLDWERLESESITVSQTGGRHARGREGLYDFEAGDDRFDEVNAYYHADSALAFLRRVGFPYVAFSSRLRIEVNARRPLDGAYYSPFDHRIVLGRGSGAPAGLNRPSRDRDVIVHEVAHAVIERIRPELRGEAGSALHEGTADYFAATLANRPEIAPYTKPPFLRTLDHALALPAGDGGAVWGAVLWDIRRALLARSSRRGRNRADRLAIGLFALLPEGDVTWAEARDGLEAADKWLTGGADRNLIRRVLQVRGIQK